jgi:hypothetical protein
VANNDPRPFADWFLEHRKGHPHREMGLRLRELAEAVEETGKPGTLTLTIKVEPMKGGGPALVVSDKIALKAPEDRPGAVNFVDKNGDLIRNDPNQMSISDIRDVLAGEERVTVDPETGEMRDAR